MARSIAEIFAIITDNVAANDVLKNEFTSTSKYAKWRLYSYVVATAQWVIEKLFDTHKAEVEEKIASRLTHGKLWYRNKALAFQYGNSLVGDTDLYATEDEEAQIVKFAACVEEEDGYLKIKVAKDGAPGLASLTGEWPNFGASGIMTDTSGGSGEKLAFYIYIQRIKDFGVPIRFVSQEADHLRISMEIYYDPLVLNSAGERLDGTSQNPVQDAIDTYLQNLPFNSEFTLMALTDALQAVNGIKIPQLLSAESHWGSFDWNVITASYIPEAGWMKIYDGDLTINWKAYGSDL